MQCDLCIVRAWAVVGFAAAFLAATVAASSQAKGFGDGVAVTQLTDINGTWRFDAIAHDESGARERRPRQHQRAADAGFFESPQRAVEAISKMLKEEDWASLARHYDLGGSDIDRKTLLSGEFFVRTERPEAAHPGGFWRYKHPFAPGFEYSFTTPADETGIVTVRVSIRIDQGAGQPVQVGWQEFRMRRSEKGFQILPD